MTRVRPAAVAGMFYPARAREVRSQVDELLAAAPPHPADGPIRALVVPHAGWVYSGHVAGRAHALVGRDRTSWTRVLLLGPTHRMACQGVALPGSDVFETPLGAVPVDVELAAVIEQLPQASQRPDVHRDEHSLEVQLPFLQVVAPDLPVLPVCCGVATPEQVAGVIDAALDHDPQTLVMVSSDLSHYLPDERARAVDAETIDQVLHLSGPLRPDQACGASPVNGLLVVAARRGWRPTLLAHATSADTIGDRDRVVGYAAFVFEEEEMTTP